MNAFTTVVLAATFLVAQGTPSPDFLKTALDPNPTLNSYTASATLSAELHAGVPVHKTFNGTAYYLRPKAKVVFNNVSGPLSRFRELATQTPTYAEMSTEYTLSPRGDDGKTSTYVLAPSKAGARVKSVTLSVDDHAKLVMRAVWSYTNGGTLTVSPHYSDIGEFHLPTTEDISARFPDYSVDGTLRLSGYQPGAHVDPSIFVTKN